SALLEAVAMARKLGASEVIRRAATLIGALPEANNADEEQIALLREALASLPDDCAERPLLLALLAKSLSYSSDDETRVSLARSASKEALGLSDPMLRADTLHHCHRALGEPSYLG